MPIFRRTLTSALRSRRLRPRPLRLTPDWSYRVPAAGPVWFVFPGSGSALSREPPTTTSS